MILALVLGARAAVTMDDPAVWLGVDAHGLPIYQFGDRATWSVLPAAVVHGDPPPGALPLGGDFWKVDAVPGEDGVALARRLHDQKYDVFPDVLLPTRPAFDDPEYGGQWYLEDLAMEPLYAISEGDPSIVVAVIDSGIDVAGTDLAAGIVGALDVFAGDDDPSPEKPSDVHGTAVTGIAGARANNGFGIVGMCPSCSLVAIRLLGDNASAMSTVVAAYEYAIEKNAAVINNSWGYDHPVEAPSSIAAAIEDARTRSRDGKGALVVFAAGNDNREIEDQELTGLPGVLCVSAIDSYGNPTNYTNYGASVDVSAPSATVTIGPSDTIITNFGGTSAAAPVVSGLAGWALSVDPSLTADELGELLIATSVPNPLVEYDANGHNDVYGYGTISPASLVAALFPDTAGGASDSGKEAEGGCGCGASRATAAYFLAMLLIARRRR
jgi:subtilisin family serine protease